MGFSDSFLIWYIRNKLSNLQDRYYIRFKNLPVEPLDLPPHVKPTDLLNVIEMTDAHMTPEHRSVVQFSYNHDIEGYKGGRLIYFKIYEFDFSRPDLLRDMAVYCNGQLFYDPDDKLVWPIIKSLEDIYSDDNFQNRVGTINWELKQRKQLIGKPDSDYAYHGTRNPIPKHFIRVIANKPDFKAPYDEKESVAGAPSAPQMQYQMSQQPREEPSVSKEPDIAVTEDDDFGRDQY